MKRRVAGIRPPAPEFARLRRANFLNGHDYFQQRRNRRMKDLIHDHSPQQHPNPTTCAPNDDSSIFSHNETTTAPTTTTYLYRRNGLALFGAHLWIRICSLCYDTTASGAMLLDFHTISRRPDKVAGPVSREAVSLLERLFSGPNSTGSRMAARAAAPMEPIETTAASCAALTGDLLGALRKG